MTRFDFDLNIPGLEITTISMDLVDLLNELKRKNKAKFMEVLTSILEIIDFDDIQLLDFQKAIFKKKVKKINNLLKKD